jgi:hypothetical protein
MIIFIILLVFCSNFIGFGSGFKINNNERNIMHIDNSNVDGALDEYKNIFLQKSDNTCQEEFVSDIDLPWLNNHANLLEWSIRLDYNGETYQQQVPIDIFDFKEKFLKHPEYGEILRFDIDADPENDIEVIVGFYWSLIKDADGRDVESLEKRIRVRQLESGDYIDDPDGDLTVWSELHVNYGLIQKSKSKGFAFLSSIQSNLYKMKLRLNDLLECKHPFLSLTLLNNLLENGGIFDDSQPVMDENDYIVVGAGYQSPEGQDIPRYAEKRFSFARQDLSSPTIFQHIMDPGSSKGKGPFKMLYGFQSYKSGSTIASFNIEFSTEFNPAVYLKTKFIPINGYIYYYFDQASQRNSPTEITFSSNVLKGMGENIELSLILDSIDESIGQSGKWMSFDIDMLGDNELLGGNIHYDASNKFNIGMIVNSPLFEERIELRGIPTRVDLSWDVDFFLLPTPNLYVHTEGFIDVSMSSDLESIQVYYPNTDGSNEDQIFIEVPDGIPQDTRFEAEATLNVNLMNLQSAANYIYGKIKHTCSSNINCVQAFLPDEETPIVKVTEIPSDTEVRGQLNWGILQGYAYVLRGSVGPPDPVEINIEYQGFKIHDVLTIRDGFIDTKFRIGDNGYFFFDTSKGIFGNSLYVSNAETGDMIGLFVDEVSADALKVDWDIDTSGDQLKVNDLSFGGMVDTMKGLVATIQYQGRSAVIEMDWLLQKEGFFEIIIDQDAALSLNFDDFAINNSDFDLSGEITINNPITFDMSWDLQQGDASLSGSVDPGHFTINQYTDNGIIQDFDFYLTYQDRYGVSISFEDLQFYLDFEWWKGERILPYIWLDYEVSSSAFDIDLLWTNIDGQTEWYENVEDW